MVVVPPAATRQPDRLAAIDLKWIPDPREPSTVSSCDEKVVLTLIVQPRRVRVARSEIGLVEWVHLDDLEAELREIKATEFFRDRADIVIAADGITYQELIDVLALAKEVGFVDIGYTTPEIVAMRY